MKSTKIISTLFLLLSTLLSFGQDRVNRQKISFDTTSQVLLKATGWDYNSSIGEWVDYNNVICGDKAYKGKYSSLQTLKFKTNINCGGCVAKVTPFLNEGEGICHWDVDTASKDKILSVHSEGITEEEVMQKVKEAGFKIELLTQ